MKKPLTFILIEAGAVLTVYAVLLRILAGTNIIAGVFCPGPHLPSYYPVLILLFLISRLYVVLLPGILLSRLVLAWLKTRRPRLIRNRTGNTHDLQPPTNGPDRLLDYLCRHRYPGHHSLSG